MAVWAGLSCVSFYPSFRIKTCMHSHARMYTHTHLEKIRFRRLHLPFPTWRPRWNIYYAWQSCRPLTCYLINGRKAQAQKNPNNRSSKEGRGDKPAVISPGGSSKAHPKLISLSLLWSAGRWGNKEGRAKRWEGGEWKMEFIRKLASAL